MFGKIEFNVLNIEIRKLDDNREMILMDVAMPDPYGAGMVSKARWTMTVPRGTANNYYTDHIQPILKK
jgi:hypothetical protein